MCIQLRTMCILDVFLTKYWTDHYVRISGNVLAQCPSSYHKKRRKAMRNIIFDVIVKMRWPAALRARVRVPPWRFSSQILFYFYWSVAQDRFHACREWRHGTVAAVIGWLRCKTTWRRLLQSWLKTVLELNSCLSNWLGEVVLDMCLGQWLENFLETHP